MSSWRRVSDHEPPPTEIVIIGTPTGNFPVHARWLITDKAGIRIDASLNSLGKKTTEIHDLTEIEAKNRENEIDQYLYRARREINGERLSFKVIIL